MTSSFESNLGLAERLAEARTRYVADIVRGLSRALPNTVSAHYVKDETKFLLSLPDKTMWVIELDENEETVWIQGNPYHASEPNSVAQVLCLLLEDVK